MLRISHFLRKTPSVNGRILTTRGAKRSSGPSAMQLAQQRERAQNRDQLVKKAKKKQSSLRASAYRGNYTALPKIELPMAYRLVRAAEVGQPVACTTLSLGFRLVFDRGTPPVTGRVRLPYSFGSEDKLVVFTTDDSVAERALKAGAVLAGAEEVIEKVVGSPDNFTAALATPEIVPGLGKAARTLGPRGLMPTTRRGTVVQPSELENAIAARIGAREFRSHDVMLSIPFGRAHFSDIQLTENLRVVHEAVMNTIKDLNQTNKRRPMLVAEKYIASTHSPGIVLDNKLVL
ncbi:hypothetical protein CANCADRAFT_31169, partial [Tortispora caseinolytica NRRL Y-17796]